MTTTAAAPSLDELGKINEVLARIGAAQRELVKLAVARDTRIAAANAEHEVKAAELRRQIEADTDVIESACTAHRAHLTASGKTVTLPAGKLGWRQGQASLVYTGTDKDLVAALRELKLTKFVRLKAEPDRLALKKSPEVVAKVPGLSLVPGAETFFLDPA